MKLRWKRSNERVYFGYRGKEDMAMVFGAPAPSQLWCAIVWYRDGHTNQIQHVCEYRGMFQSAKRWAELKSGELNGGASPAQGGKR